ncbi:MAPEG family protein, partial [Planktotalea sp.]|uniref:MAPEG family protein n=1 Tax=Planktotalea sp. TaxID=2029877 RepID=UPI00329A1401
MTPELTALGLAALLQVLQFCAYSLTSVKQVGVKKAAGPRDNAIVLSGVAGRLQRAMNNHFEALTLFTIAVVLITYSDQSSPVTMLCAF